MTVKQRGRKEIRWNATKADAELAKKIAARAVAESLGGATKANLLDLEMDIIATHLNGCPLDLEKLLAFDGFNFAHDVLGINQHMNRETGELQDLFCPRCAQKQTVLS